MSKKVNWKLYKVDDNLVEVNESMLKGLSVSDLPSDTRVRVDFDICIEYDLDICKVDDTTVEVYLSEMFRNKYFSANSVVNATLYMRLIKKAIEKGNIFSIVEFDDANEDDYNCIEYKATLIGKTMEEILELTNKMYHDLDKEVNGYVEEIADMINDYIEK